MSGSIAETRPNPAQRPVLRRLADLLPSPGTPPTPAAPQSAPPSAADPAASVQAERVLRAVVEILSGRRPARQLSAVLHPDLLTQLADLQAVAETLRPRVHKVLARPQGAGTLEAVALLTLSTGVRALAARFERQVDEAGSRWRCTALQLRFTTGDLAARRRLRS